jgi:hydroxymethylpyrimidine/phosphomethylpyrimidine kinase
LLEDKGVWLRGERIETRSTHGTGCAFSSALLAELVLGRNGVEAVEGAKRYVADALHAAYPIGNGRGPLHHLFRFEPSATK